MTEPNFLRRAIPILVAVVVFALNVGATIQLFAGENTFGYDLTYTDDYRVARILPGTSAAGAGIVPGDYLDFTASSVHDRILGLDYGRPRVNETITVRVVHGGVSRTVTLRARPLAKTGPFAVVLPSAAFARLAGFAYIVVALAIVLRRPSRMTWGLYLYLLSASDVALLRAPLPLFLAGRLIYDVLAIAGPIGLIVFAARFPNDASSGWRSSIDRWSVPMAAVFAVPNLAWDATALAYGSAPARWMAFGSTLGALALIALAATFLAMSYAASAPKERKRLQWIIAGVLASLLSYASGWAEYLSAAYPLVTAPAVVWAGATLYAIAPFPIAYAVVRHRVFDVSFVVSRTIVYTILTAVIFALFSFLEWLAVRFLEHIGFAIALVVVASIAIGFWFNSIHARVDRIVDRVLFRRRHAAEKQLGRVTSALLAADTSAAIEEALVHEPMVALELNNAVLFRRDGDGRYLRARGEGTVSPSAPATLDQHLLLHVQGEAGPLRLHEVVALEGYADADPLKPVLAIPTFVRSRLEAVTLYGAHVNGEDIDPDELAMLAKLATAAAVAYSNVDAQRMTTELQKWRDIAEHEKQQLLALQNGNAGQQPDAAIDAAGS